MIYLDYHATTPIDPRVAEKVLQAMTTHFGNASSIDHEVGDRVEAAVKAATRQVADLVSATPETSSSPPGPPKALTSPFRALFSI